MNAIPTKAFGVQFRSRLEAKWAWMFHQLGVTWHYEPLDLAGYVPDFVVDWGGELLVECKPELRHEDLVSHMPRIFRAGWRGDALIVGGVIPVSAPGMGNINALCVGHAEIGNLAGPALLFGQGSGKGRWTLGFGRAAGALPAKRRQLEEFWVRAGNEVQWKKPAWTYGDQRTQALGRILPSPDETARFLEQQRAKDREWERQRGAKS